MAYRKTMLYAFSPTLPHKKTRDPVTTRTLTEKHQIRHQIRAR